MSRDLMIALSYAEAVLLVVVLSIGLNQVRRRLQTISDGLAALAGALSTVQSQHLRPLGQMVTNINRPLNVAAGALPGIAAKAAFVVRKVTGG